MSDDTYQIGCIDGSVIHATRSTDGWTLRLEGLEARLSNDGTSKLVEALTAGAADPPPGASATPTAPGSRHVAAEISHADDNPQPAIFEAPPAQPHQPRRETINDLIEAGLLVPGAILEATYKGEQHLAKITEGGYLDIDGNHFATPSAAAESVMPGKYNGWKEWRVLEGPGLAELRWQYRVGTFPEHADTLSEATVSQKRSVAESWLEFALERDLHPGKRNDTAVEDLLGDRGLSERTLSNYRTHLDQWFEQCERNKW